MKKTKQSNFKKKGGNINQPLFLRHKTKKMQFL